MIRKETTLNTTKTAFFNTLVWNQRKEIISWLRFKYNNLSYADAEDIYQDASCELWKKFCTMNEWHGEPLIGLFKVICSHVYTHWLRKQSWEEDWDDKFYPEDNGVETDYGYVSSETAYMLLKERMYTLINQLEATERELMTKYLQKVRMDEIARQLGFRNAQVARNRKCKIVVKLKEINAQADNACASFFLTC